MVSVSLAIILNSAGEKKNEEEAEKLDTHVLFQRLFCIGYWAFPILVNYFINDIGI